MYSVIFNGRKMGKTFALLLSMKISTKLRDVDRHYLQNLIVSGCGEIPDKDGKVSSAATHTLIVENGFIVSAKKIIRVDNSKK